LGCFQKIKYFSAIMKINSIGSGLVKCNFKCEGVVNDKKKGIIPRCLIYEGRNGKNGAIVIGINPGKSSKEEQKFLLKGNCNYQAILDFWDLKAKNFAYYKKSRELITDLGFTGDILWTDLAKCECRGKNGDVPIQTLRICIDRFLEKEIKALSDNFVIIALGNVAFNFCSLRFPDRFVIGLPHPTGAYGTFARLRKNIRKNRKKYIAEIKKTKDQHDYSRAIKLFN